MIIEILFFHSSFVNMLNSISTCQDILCVDINVDKRCTDINVDNVVQTTALVNTSILSLSERYFLITILC